MANVRKLIITECRPISTGRSSSGTEYTIYDIKATREDHTPLDDQMKLRSFTELALNVLAEFTVESYDSPRYGRSYTLKPNDARGQAPSTKALLKEALERIGAIERKLEQVALRVYGGDSGDGYVTAGEAPAPQPPPQPPPPEPPAPSTHRPGGDIPF